MSAFLFGSWKARYLIWSIALAIGCLPLYEMTNGCNLIKLVDLQDISLLCVVVHWQPESESLHIRTCNPAITYESLNIFKSKFLYYLKRDLKLLSHVITNTAACGEFDGISTNLSICRIILSVSICNDDRFPMKMELLSFFGLKIRIDRCSRNCQNSCDTLWDHCFYSVHKITCLFLTHMSQLCTH